MSVYTEAGEQHVEAQEDVVVIDPEIEALIPSLKPDEQSKLRESIKTEGCRDPLVVWKGRNILLAQRFAGRPRSGDHPAGALQVSHPLHFLQEEDL